MNSLLGMLTTAFALSIVTRMETPVTGGWHARGWRQVECGDVTGLRAREKAAAGH